MEMNAIKMLEIWKKCIGQEGVQLNEERKNHLSLLLKDHLQNDLSAWERLCEQIKKSRFLMGEGPSGWKITLDWILKPVNLCKVLEGKFYDQKCANSEKDSTFSISDYVRGSEDLSPLRKAQVQTTLSKIKDSTWKQWCSHLNFNPCFRTCVLPWQLESIIHARFLGIEEDRLAWISCADYLTLNRVEDLRSQLLSVIQRTYPFVRAIRTCLEGENPLKEEVSSKEVGDISSKTSQRSSSSSEDAPSRCMLSDSTPLRSLGQLTQNFQIRSRQEDSFGTAKSQKKEEEDQDLMDFYEESTTRKSAICPSFITPTQRNNDHETTRLY